MITTILNKLQVMMAMQAEGTEAIAGAGTIATLTSMFNVNLMIPPYFLQIVVGLYIVEIIIILSGTLVRVESGVDKLNEKATIAKNLRFGVFLYLIVAAISMIALSVLAAVATGGIAG
jgi:hypothetical protein